VADDHRPPVKLHDGEADIDAELVRRLVAGQFPELRDLPVRAVPSTGTVNASTGSATTSTRARASGPEV
jgi:hypothetical protein